VDGGPWADARPPEVRAWTRYGESETTIAAPR
jgi:hypothetical protein